MASTGPLKYLVLYPFLPLTVAKILNMFFHVGSVALWQYSSLRTSQSFSHYAIYSDLICIAILLVSLWFTVQKFYWTKLELAFCLAGAVLCAVSICLQISEVLSHSAVLHILLNHVLALLAWLFCLWWSQFRTKNTVSNLFISDWGAATVDVEIEALQDHF